MSNTDFIQYVGEGIYILGPLGIVGGYIKDIITFLFPVAVCAIPLVLLFLLPYLFQRYKGSNESVKEYIPGGRITLVFYFVVLFLGFWMK